MTRLFDIITMSLEAARKAGAEQADAVLIEERSLEVSLREGAVEHVERAEGHDLGLRVFVNKSQAIVSMSKLDRTTINEAAQQAVDMARVAPEDAYAGLADEARLARQVPDLDLWDDREVDE